MKPRQSHARIQVAITGKAKTIGPVEAHERNVLAITRRIHTKSRKLRDALALCKRLREELRADRRELRAILQRDSTITAEMADNRLADAGKADAIDAAEAHRERE